MRSPSRFVFLALLTTLFVSGCESVPSTTSLNLAQRDYQAGRFESAHRNALKALQTPNNTDRYKAAYLAGLSSYQLGNLDQADQHLLLALKATNSQTQARTKAMLGTIRLDQQRPLDAANLFKDAALALKGTDARQAAHRAALAFQQAGDETQAETWFARASGDLFGQTYAPVRAPEMAEFTLQVGAFRERARAQNAADNAAELAKDIDIGTVRVIPRTNDRGQELYIVQVGQFATRQEASRAKAKLGRLEYIVTSSLPDPSTPGISGAPGISTTPGITRTPLAYP